jgi:multicomponent Na+:H+ antiporter subunit G
MQVVAAALVLLAALLSVLAAVGLLRFPDTLTRMQAATKVGSLSTGLALAAAAMALGDAALAARLAAILVLVLLMTVVVAHVLARAACPRSIAPEGVTSRQAGSSP